MSELKVCPYCGKNLYKNEIGDKVCVIHGIIELSEVGNEDKNKERSYIG